MKVISSAVVAVANLEAVGLFFVLSNGIRHYGQG
jgi:hypothetical protein